MATRTSVQSGDWSDSATWGAAAPGDGDIAIISTGHTVTVTSDATVGSNSSAVGKGINIKATDQTTFGKLVVNDGITLTLKGNDTTTNAAMLIDRYAVFEPAPGAIIKVDCASAFQTIIDNNGIINAIGTVAKPITFSSPAANYSWNNDAVGEAFSSSAHKYNPAAKISCVVFNNHWVSNAAGTGIGSFGDTSVTFGGANAAAFTTEKSALSGVLASGDYYIDYDLGVVFFYWDPAGGNPSFTKTYKYLTNTKGWGITSDAGTTYNEAKFQYCTFEYMGSSAISDTRCLNIQSHQSAAVAANRLFYLKNSTARYCHKFLGFKSMTGTLADPILVDSNTFLTTTGSSSVGATIAFYRSASTYVSITNNTFKCRNYGILMTQSGAVIDFTGFKATGNTALLASSFLTATVNHTRLPSAEISGNTFNGTGNASDHRSIAGAGGSSGNNLTITANTFDRTMRACHFSSYLRFTKNIVSHVYHHGFVGPVEDDVYLTDIECTNNAFIGEASSAGSGYDSSPSIELGYNHRHHIDDMLIAHNTFQGNISGAVGFGDMQDTSTFAVGTRIRVLNNLCKRTTASTSYAWRRVTNGATKMWRGHVSAFDYNLDHNVNTRYDVINRQGTFTTPTNCTGVSLYDPNFASASGKTLDFTYTSATDQTLAYDGGTAIQLVLDSGTATAGANTTTDGAAGLHSGTLTDSGKSWTTTKSDSASPWGRWVKITANTGVGQIRMITNNTATVLTTVPAWTTPPDATSTYVIIKSEVTLDDGADTVRAGIYLPSLPTSTQADTGLAFADHSVTGSDPLLANAGGTTAVDYKITTGSPAINVGSTAVTEVTDDYFATVRDATPDIGFHEFVAAAAASGAGPGTYLRWTAGRLNVRVPPHYRR